MAQKDLKDVDRDKLDLTTEQREILKEIFGVELPLHVEVIREKNADPATNKKFIITDELDEQESLDATCAAWC